MSVAWNRAESLSNCSKRLEATPFVSIIKSIYHRVRSFPLKSFKTQITQSVEAPSSEIMAKRHKKKNFPFNNNQIWLWMNLGIYFALATRFSPCFGLTPLQRRLLRSDKRRFNPRPRRSLSFQSRYRFILHD